MNDNCETCKSDNLKVKSIYIKRIEESDITGYSKVVIFDDTFKKVDLKDSFDETTEQSISFQIKAGDIPECNKPFFKWFLSKFK